MSSFPLFYFLVELLLLSCFANGDPDLLDELELCRPQQIHIAYGSSVAEMVIIWSTSGQCASSVKYGTLPQKLDMSVPGEDRMFESDWNKDGVKYMHKVKLRGLTPKTVYYYQPWSNGIHDGPFYFSTPASDHSENVKFMAISDLNTTSPIMGKLLDEVEKGRYKALLHTGNIAMRLRDEGGKNGDLYMKLMSMAVKSTPYMTAPGIMESDGETFAQYIHRFAMPHGEWPMSLDTLWYSIDIGLVHLVSFSTEVFFTNDGKYTTLQHNWLIRDLKIANENRDRVPWIVAFGHRPFYCSSRDPDLFCNKNKSQIRDDLEDIMFHYGVDLVLTSYGENYERSYPIYKGVTLTKNYTDPVGPIYISLGAASPFESIYNFSTTKEDWLAFRHEDESDLTFGRLNIMNASFLAYEQVSFTSRNIIDSFAIMQEKHGKFSTSDLPPSVKAIINKQIIDNGGQPDEMNIEETGDTKPITTKSKITEFIEEIKSSTDSTKIVIGVGVAAGLFVLLISLVIVRRVCRGRRRRSARRWENMDINYGKRYYNKANDKDDFDNDFEIDVPETTEPSRKLLTDD